MSKFGLFATKKEMTRMWLEGAYIPVTLLHIPNQEVVRYKTVERDGYSALVLGLDKTESSSDKGQKVSYAALAEFAVDDDFVQANPAGTSLSVQLLDGITALSLSNYGKGKGFQGGMKRFHLKGGNKTRGSKFHRRIGSMGNRKPRRTQKGHPHAGRMGNELTTLKSVPVIDTILHDGEAFLAVKGSVPGSYNSLVKIMVS